MTSASIQQLRAFTKEEVATAKLYGKLHYPLQAKQERQHAKFFKKLSEFKAMKKLRVEVNG